VFIIIVNRYRFSSETFGYALTEKCTSSEFIYHLHCTPLVILNTTDVVLYATSKAPFNVRTLLKIHCTQIMKLLIYCDSFISVCIFQLTNFLLFTARARHSDRFMNSTVAKQRKSSGHRTILHYRTGNGRTETGQQMELLDGILYGKSKIKVKLSLCFNRAPRHESVLGEWRYSSAHF